MANTLMRLAQVQRTTTLATMMSRYLEAVMASHGHNWRMSMANTLTTLPMVHLALLKVSVLPTTKKLKSQWATQNTLP